MVIWVKILKTEKTLEIHLVRLTEVRGKGFSEKYAYKLVKTSLLLSNVMYYGPPKQLFVYEQRPFFITFMGRNWCSR